MRRRPHELHSDWLRLLEPDGPFFTAPVLKQTYPLGLDRTEPALRVEARERWAEVREAEDRSDYVWWLLGEALGWQPRLERGETRCDDFSHEVVEHGVTLTPDAVLLDGTGADARPRVLVSTYAPVVTPNGRMRSSEWSATAVQRMSLLCRAVGCELGLVTNGDLFTLVWAPRNGPTGQGTWRASLFSSEPTMLDSFTSLLSLRRFFGMGAEDTPEAMLTRSVGNQQEVTNTLGRQARRAVELLVNAISRGNLEQKGRLLEGVNAHEVYEAAVTVLMRMVILLTAEERGLLPASDTLYATTYAVSTMKADLEEAQTQLSEQLELRSTAWHRLLAVSRAVHGGVNHPDLRIAAYGSRLFDPDRFPFLEGRRAGEAVGRPLPIDDLSMLGILRALQELEIDGEVRKLSYKHLEVEQIGHVYEGLLDHSAVAAERVMLGVVGRKGDEPEVPLEALESARLDGPKALIAFLQERSGKTERQLTKLLDQDVTDGLRRGLLVACDNDVELMERILPFANLLRLDLREIPLVFRPGAMFVTETSQRRDSGTAYTTRELAEEVAQYALEPLVYSPGPLDTGDQGEWKLKSSGEILDLRVCDPAVGSGAILVAACRYLADRVMEAWEAEGVIDSGDRATAEDPSALDVRVGARRAVAERCLYAVDRDPMAVEMAKLSLWLITMAKERPFSFLDHAIVAGDSLLGITDIRQLTHFNIDPKAGGQQLMASASLIEDAVKRAAELRLQLEETPVQTVVDAEQKRRLLAESQEITTDLGLLADVVVGAALAGASRHQADDPLMASLADATGVLESGDTEAAKRIAARSQRLLDVDMPPRSPSRRPFHWALSFPEICGHETSRGFDVFVGNPPFKRGKGIREVLGSAYREYLVEIIASGKRASADLVAYFFQRAQSLSRSFGLIGINSISQTDSRVIALDAGMSSGWKLYRARTNVPWPGGGPLVSMIWGTRSPVHGQATLNGVEVPSISSSLSPDRGVSHSFDPLKENSELAFQGVVVVGEGFLLDDEEAAALLEARSENAEVVMPYLNGADAYGSPLSSASRWAINFKNMTEEEAQRFGQCWQIVEERVRPVRRRLRDDGSFVLRKPLPQRWWQYGDKRPALHEAIREMDRVMVITRSSRLLLPVFVSTHQVIGDKLAVIARDDYFTFGVFSSSFHVLWAQRKMRPGVSPTYSPRDHAGSFPMPLSGFEVVSSIAEALDAYRSQVLRSRQLGVTRIYGLVNNPDNHDKDIEGLRAQHVRLDHAVKDAYGWDNLQLEHGIADTQLGFRYSVVSPVSDEVYDRLLELNHQRHAKELEDGLDNRSAERNSKTPSLFDDEEKA